jgi:peptidoglycan/LPS O-acetylase OafA/YrhL
MVENAWKSRSHGRAIVGLDLIRFAAAFLVVIYHLGHRAWAPPVEQASIRQLMPNSPAYPELEPVAWLGWVGVEIFFVISGLVIANSAENSSPFHFLRSRVLRLAPGIWVCATITLLAVLLIKGDFDSRTFVFYGRTMALPLFPRAPWIDSVYWTLIVELVFYGVIFVMLALDRFRHIEVLAIFMGLSSAGVWVLHIILDRGDWFLGSWTAHVLLLRHGCFFAAGILLWLVLFNRVSVLRIAVLGFCLVGAVIEVGQLAETKADVIGRDLSVLGAQILFLFGFVAIALSVLFNPLLSKVLGQNRGLVATLGLMTYPLYLVHNVAGVGVLNFLDDLGFQRHISIVLSSLAMVGLAWLVCRTAEPKIAGFMRPMFATIGERGRQMAPIAWLFRETSPVRTTEWTRARV